MYEGKFAKRVDGTKTEKTGERNSDYSAWHRTLGPEYFSLDIDFIEFRKDRGIVAVLAVTGKCKDENHIINSKKYIWQRTELEREVLKTLSKKLSVPSYYVIHTNDLSIFHVHDLNRNLDDFKKMNQEGYAQFIKAM